MSVASLVLGIISLVIAFFSVGTLGWLGIIFGIIGIILGCIGRKKLPEDKKGLATAGFVCSIVGTVMCAVMFLACVLIGGVAAGVHSAALHG